MHARITHPQIENALQIAGALEIVAREFVRLAAAQFPPAARKRRGATLRPGPGTPMWNALGASIKPHLKKRGTKANLARVLGVPPQRINDYFVRGISMPDGERVVLLISWLAQKQAGVTPA